MADLTLEVTAEDKEFATQLVSEGLYSSPSEVLHAAMDALRREQEENRLLERFAQEAEDSGGADGDVIGRLAEKHGLKRPAGI